MSKTHLTDSVVLMVTLAMLLGCGKKPDDGAQQQPTPQPNVGPGPNTQPKRPSLGEPKYRITFDQLLTEYGEKKDMALSKYDGVVIEVSGQAYSHASILTQHGPGGTDAEYLAGYQVLFQFDTPKLKHDTKGNAIHLNLTCHVPERSTFGKIHSGQEVTVRGRMKASGSIMSKLEDCELVKLGPETAIRTTSKDLAKESKAMALDDFRAKYLGRELWARPKTVILTGVVVRSVVDSGSVVVELEGADGVRVSCDLGGNAEYLFKNGFPAGDVVTFACEFAYEQERLKSGVIAIRNCIPIHREATMNDLIRRR
jgi:hypothetical protein